MWYILSKVILVFTVILLLPTGAVLASQNAIPGDSTYPVKRFLESAIVNVASIHPATRAYFKTDFSKRRFKETMALLDQGKKASESLEDLVKETSGAVDSVKVVSDKAAKRKLISELITQIDGYQSGLTTAQKKSQPKPKPTTPASQPTSQPASNNSSNSRTRTTPTSTPVPPPAAVPVSPSTGISQDEYDEAMKRLQEELERLKKEQAITQSRTGNQLANAPTPTPAVGAASGGSGQPLSGAAPTAAATSAPAPTTANSTPTPRPTCNPTLGSCLASIPTNTPTPVGGAPTATPTPVPQSLSISGSVSNIAPVYSGNTLLNFKYAGTANDSTGQLMKGELYVIKSNGSEMSDSECGNGNGTKAAAPNQAWCNIATISLSGASATFNGSWKPAVQGSYYAVVNIFSNTITNGNRLWCSGNPWCKFNGSNSCAVDSSGASCITCSGIGYCGANSYRSFTY